MAEFVSIRILGVAAILVLIISSASNGQDDPIEKELVSAQERFASSEKELREALVSSLNREREKAQRSGNLNALKSIDAELDAFNKNGTLPTSVSTSRFVTQLDRSRVRLIATFEDAVRRYTKDGKLELAETVQKQLAEIREGRSLASEEPLFNGKNLEGWQGLSNFWFVADGEIVGARAGGDRFNTCLVSTKTYGNFELWCKIKLLGNAANSGIHFRSSIDDPRLFKVIGHQCDAGSTYWGSVYSTQTGMVAEPKAELVRSKLRPNDYNDLYLKVSGKHVTVMLNGATTVDQEIADLPESGVIGFELHYGKGEAVRLFVKDIAFKSSK